ncbi:transposase [Salegentibacter sp. F14]
MDNKIKQTINEDEHLKKLYKLVTSVKGIGKVSAIQIIVATNEFRSITEAKKFACFAGVAPFEHTSGTSVNGRAHVSHMADKSIKCALHMAALAAVRESGELQDYFLRKVGEGKNKMSVINAVRNKLILRVFACVRNNRLYRPVLP